jgi:cell division protein ZapA (FtsZ GTPase activity inhibitor)
MKQKEITINGKAYPVVFSIKTMMGFEDITGKTFFGETFRSIGDKTALVFAAIIAADDKTKLTFDELMNADTVDVLNDIGTAFNKINELANEFFKIPAVEPQPEKTEEKEGDNQKN